jgi:hypothetical protein
VRHAIPVALDARLVVCCLPNKQLRVRFRRLRPTIQSDHASCCSQQSDEAIARPTQPIALTAHHITPSQPAHAVGWILTAKIRKLFEIAALL